MTATDFIILISACSIITGLIVEGIKKLISDENRKTNLIACITGLVVGVLAAFAFYLYKDIAIDAKNIIAAVFLGLGSALGATIGYDKVKQAIAQIIGGTND